MTIHRSDRHDFVYVQTDIPDGIAIGDWRAQRAAELMALRSARRWRRRRRLWRRIARPRWPRHVGGRVVRG